ncbi:hypothetical protein HK100_005712, partial [Physocladia obscura]
MTLWAGALAALAGVWKTDKMCPSWEFTVNGVPLSQYDNNDPATIADDKNTICNHLLYYGIIPPLVVSAIVAVIAFVSSHNSLRAYQRYNHVRQRAGENTYIPINSNTTGKQIPMPSNTFQQLGRQLEQQREQSAWVGAVFGLANGVRTALTAGEATAEQLRAELLVAQGLVSQLQSEQHALYRTQSINAQRLLDMVEQSRADQAALAALPRERATNAALAAKLRDATDALREKDVAMQVLKDEASALQLELGQREHQLRAALHDADALRDENATLVARWISLKQDEAARMNEANEFVESALKSKNAESLQRRQSANNQLTLDDFNLGAVKSTFIGSMQAIMSCAFSVDNRLVMASSNDNSIK